MGGEPGGQAWSTDPTPSLASMKELQGLWEMRQNQVRDLRLLGEPALECLMSPSWVIPSVLRRKVLCWQREEWTGFSPRKLETITCIIMTTPSGLGN